MVLEFEGPTHRYLGASPGCWAIFWEVLAREYEDLRYRRGLQLTVDAYAAQHPGDPSPQTIQSVTIHLISLYLTLERARSSEETIAANEISSGWIPRLARRPYDPRRTSGR